MESRSLISRLGNIFLNMAIVLLVGSVTVMITLAMAWMSINIFFDIHNKLYGF